MEDLFADDALLEDPSGTGEVAQVESQAKLANADTHHPKVIEEKVETPVLQ